MRNKHSGKDFVLGAMVGSTIGALSAMMLTTKQGHKVKEELIDKYHELEDIMKGYVKSNKRKATHALKKIAKNIDKKIKRAKKKIRVKRRKK